MDEEGLFQKSCRPADLREIVKEYLIQKIRIKVFVTLMKKILLRYLIFVKFSGRAATLQSLTDEPPLV
jgi:hypothetical protein